MGHTDLCAVIDNGGLVQGKLKICGSLQLLWIALARIEETAHVMVIEEGREKIIATIRSKALPENLLQLLAWSGSMTMGNTVADDVAKGEIQNAVKLAIIFPLDALLGHAEHPSKVFVPDMQGRKMSPGNAFEPGLSDQDGSRVILFYFLSEVFPEGMSGTDHMIQPEAVQSKGQPISRRPDDMVSRFRVVQVQFRQFLHIKEAQIIIGPSVEDKPVYVPALSVFPGFFKEGVFMRTVIRNEVCNNSHTRSMGVGDEVFQVVERAKAGLDVQKISHMIPVVGAGFAERRKPEGVDAQILQIGKFFHNGVEVSAQKLRLKLVFGDNAGKPVDQYVIDYCLLKPIG